MSLSNLNLPKNSAIQFVDTDVFVVHLDTYGGPYYQDDVKIDSGYQILTHYDNIVTKRADKRLVSYQLLSDGVLVGNITVDEYNTKKSEFLKHHVDSDGEYLSNKSALAVAIFKEDHLPVYETLSISTSVPINFLGEMVDPKSKYISCLLTTGKPVVNGSLYCLNVRQLETDMFHFCLNKFKDIKFVNSSHSFLRFAQVNGSYILDDSWDEKRSSKFYGSLETCQKEEERLNKVLYDFFIARISSVLVGTKLLDVHGLQSALNSLYKTVSCLSVTSGKVAQDNHRSCLTELRNIQKNIDMQLVDIASAMVDV